MSDIGVIVVLYLVGVLILMADIFLPSHGILTLSGLGVLIAAVVKTFSYGGRDAGIVAVLGCLVFLPTFAYLAIKYWHRTPMGKLISPPNPVLTAKDVGLPVEELSRLIGATGRSVSPLRPVGICEFNGRRVSCMAQFGMLDAGVPVEGYDLSGGTLTVIEKKT